YLCRGHCPTHSSPTRRSSDLYSLLGGLRSSAQMISYEVSMGLALVTVFLMAGSLSTSEIVAAQHDWWFGALLLPSFLIYCIAMRSEEHTSELQSRENLVCRLL